MGRRVLAFFLGMLFGIIFVFGAVAGGLFIAATVIHPVDVYPDSEKFLGNLASMSLLDIYNEISALYKEKLGIRDNGKYFTFGEFCEYYEINPSEMFGGKEVPQEVLDVPIFELIGGDRTQAQEQIKVSVLPALLNMFIGGGSDEDGSSNPLFPESVMTKLSAYSIVDLQAENGLATVFADVRIAEVAMGMLPLERDEENALIWAIGQARLGPIIGGMGGNMLTQFQEGGAFDEMGKIPLTEILGDSSNILNAFLKDNAIADLIDEEGNLNPDAIMNSVYLGEIVGLQRKKLTDEDAESYQNTQLADEEKQLLLNDADEYALKTADGVYSAKLVCTDDGEEHVHTLDCYGFVWYSSTAASDHSENDLVIDEVHYPVATGIYAAIADITIGQLTGGDSNALLNKLMDIPLKDLLEGQEMSGIFENLSGMTIGELINGGIDGLYIGELLGFKRNELTQPDGEVVALYKNYPPQEGDEAAKYLVKDADGNVAALSPDGKIWYEGEITCIKEEHTHDDECGGEGVCDKEEHTHNVSGCYGFVWYEACTDDHDHASDTVIDDTNCVPVAGMMSKLSNKQISELSNLDDMIKELTLYDVLGEDVPDILKGLKDVPVGELNDALNDLYLGELLSKRRRPITEDMGDYTAAVKDLSGIDVTGVTAKLDEEGNVLGYAKAAGDTMYEAQLKCIDEEHVHDDSCYSEQTLTCAKQEHLHNADCFGFVWYEKCSDASDSHLHEGEWIPADDNPDGDAFVPDVSMMGKLADVQVKNLGNLDEEAKKITLGEVLGDDIPGMLESLRDTPIGKLDDAIDNLYLGQLLEYRRKETDVADYSEDVLSSDGEPVVKTDGTNVARIENGVWYEARLTCTDSEHEHVETCYGFVWYKICNDAHDHEGEWLPDKDNDALNYYVEAEGMMGKLANEKVSNLGNLNETVQTFTLRDVLGDSVPEMLASLSDTPISDLNEAINNVYLGDLLKYKRKPITDLAEYSSLYENGAEEVRGNGDKYAKTDDGENWYEAVFICDDESHPHTTECYGYLWYELLSTEHDETHPADEWVDGELHYAPVYGMMGKLAREKVGDMGNLDETVQTFTLHDVLGDNVPNMLKSIADTQIKDLNTAIDEMYLGDFLQYRRRLAEELDGTTGDSYTKELSVPEGATGAVKLDEHGNAIKQEGEWYEAQLVCTNKQEDHVHDASCYGFVWYKACTEEHPHDGEWIPEEDNPESSPYVVADGMMGKLADEKVKNLGELNKTIQRFTLRDVMGEQIPSALTSLADVPLGELGGAIDDMYLGAFLQYVKKPVNGDDYTQEVAGTDGLVKSKEDAGGTVYARQIDGVWYDAALNCTNGETEHSHTLDCYRFNWYTLQCTSPEIHGEFTHDDDCYAPADKLIGRLARLKINELNGDNIVSVVNDTPLGDVLDLENSNGLLKELSNVKIGDLSNELDAIYVGIAMSYKRKAIDEDTIVSPQKVITDDNEKHHRHDEIWKDDSGNLYFRDVQHNIYYEAQLTCKETSHSHTFTCYGFVWYSCNSANDSDPNHVHGTTDNCVKVLGLNGKISNLRIDELNGASLTNIATSLTIGDLIESRMMELSPENEYKLAVIYCNDNKATLQGYATAKLREGSLTFEQYWRDAHSIDRAAELDAEQIKHRDIWKEIQLKEFIDKLLSSF